MSLFESKDALNEVYLMGCRYRKVAGQTIFINRERIGGIVPLNETVRIPYVPY